MAGAPDAGMRGRVIAHDKRFAKDTRTHFSLFEVWDNISEAEGRELEGLPRHIFRCDPAALAEIRQRGFDKLAEGKREQPGEVEPSRYALRVQSRPPPIPSSKPQLPGPAVRGVPVPGCPRSIGGHATV